MGASAFRDEKQRQNCQKDRLMSEKNKNVSELVDEEIVESLAQSYFRVFETFRTAEIDTKLDSLYLRFTNFHLMNDGLGIVANRFMDLVNEASMERLENE